MMNRHREEAFQRFEALGGIPIKRRTIFTRTPYRCLSRIIEVVLKYIKQEVEVGEIFKCHVPNLDTNLILTINGWFVQENVVPEIPEGVVICSMAEASVKYKELFERHYNQYTKPADADGLVALNTAFAQDGGIRVCSGSGGDGASVADCELDAGECGLDVVPEEHGYLGT